MKKGILILIVFIVTGITNSFGQGCSDAGFCSVGAMHSGSEDDNNRSSIGLNLGYGIGDISVGINSNRIVSVLNADFKGDFVLSEKSKLGIKIPFSSSGDTMGNGLSGLSDPIITYSTRVKKTENTQLWLSAGVRIATNDGNKDGLPMIYQTSLGTHDLILGASYQFNSWKLAVGYQQPLINGNKNASFNHSTNLVLSNSFIRKSDALLRFERLFKIKKAQLSAGLLGIYHMGEDELTFNSLPNENIDGSSGLTLNLNVSANHKLGENFQITGVVGAPLAVRKTRPDGLTRGLVVSLGINYLL